MKAITHRWQDPSQPITVPSPGRHALVRIVGVPGGPTPPEFGFAARHRADHVTVAWTDAVLVGDHLTNYPLPAPRGPIDITVIG